MTVAWDKATLTARIQSAAKRQRYPAASPDSTEIEAYQEAIRGLGRRDSVLVLGMTPELRQMALKHFSRTLAVDNNPEAIEIYRGWVDGADHETILCEDWFTFLRQNRESFDAILGDGAFGNLPNVEKHRVLLALIQNALVSGGRFVTRMALIPREFNAEYRNWRNLRDAFRFGELNEAEFGFGTRLLGHLDCCYDPSSFSLDNEKLFNEMRDAHSRGELSEHDHQIILRYFYGGRNCIVSQNVWEALLEEGGWTFRILPCYGRQWYSYYLVYLCESSFISD